MKTTTLICEQCNEFFQKENKTIKYELKRRGFKPKYCSKNCLNESNTTKISVICKNCNTEVIKKLNQVKKYSNHFCSSSCAATYNNKHKTTGFRRSKAEQFLEELIKADFPDLPIQTSVRNVLDSGLEIDILLPTLNIAIELNGPVHYFPIYGEQKLETIQNNDLRKQVELQQKGFNLIVIDISQQSYWKTSKVKLTEFYQSYIKPLLNTSDKI